MPAKKKKPKTLLGMSADIGKGKVGASIFGILPKTWFWVCGGRLNVLAFLSVFVGS